MEKISFAGADSIFALLDAKCIFASATPRKSGAERIIRERDLSILKQRLMLSFHFRFQLYLFFNRTDHFEAMGR